MRLAVLFPGQGAQAPQLGHAWRGHTAWSLMERLDASLDGAATRLLCDATEVQGTADAQRCVFSASLIAWEALRPHLPEPSAFAGHSLGQITALVAAGAVGIEIGAGLVEARARITQACAEANPGGLAALLGVTVEVAEQACADAGGCWVANDNAPGQVVVGGTAAGLEHAGAAARDLGARRVTVLDVGGAFHTPLMTGAARDLAGTVDRIAFADTAVPVIANTDARPHRDGAGWRIRLPEHIVARVRWRETIAALAADGVDTFIEVGPGGILGPLVRRCAPKATTVSVARPSDVDEFVSTFAPAVTG